jgi:hypothetical protein
MKMQNNIKKYLKKVGGVLGWLGNVCGGTGSALNFYCPRS